MDGIFTKLYLSKFMASTKEIKRRIKSIKNTKKITKAMELVAASKMRKAVGSTLASRAYAGYSWEILQSLSQAIVDSVHPLFQARESKRELIILITSNRGLCGAYNAQIIRKVVARLRESKSSRQDLLAQNSQVLPGNSEIDFITIGKKGDAALRRLGATVIASFTELDGVSLRAITPVVELAMNEFEKGTYGRVSVAYTDYKSAISQIPQIRPLLPISKADLQAVIESAADTRVQERPVGPESTGLSWKAPPTNYLFEPSYSVLINSLVEKLARMQVYQMMLESVASEESSRMVAMKNASDAAGEMIDDLTLIFNKARQASITKEISEISAGMASVS